LEVSFDADELEALKPPFDVEGSLAVIPPLAVPGRRELTRSVAPPIAVVWEDGGPTIVVPPSTEVEFFDASELSDEHALLTRTPKKAAQDRHMFDFISSSLLPRVFTTHRDVFMASRIGAPSVLGFVGAIE
jgi:hypothetical protein